jgi:hypothetical protein
MVLTHKSNEGYGKSLIDGFNYGINKKYKFIITMDCDKQHQPKDIKKFMRLISTEKWDIVSGSRYLNKLRKTEFKKIPKDRFKINKKITKKINRITKFNLTDSFCGFKAYKVSSLKKLFLTEPGYGMPVQFWIQAYKNRFKIKEIPIKPIYLDYSRNFKYQFKNPKERYKYYLGIIKRELKELENENFGNFTAS